jgi:hypothetical protein
MVGSAVRVIEFPREVFPRRQGRSALRISDTPLPVVEALARSAETLPASEGKMTEVMAAAGKLRSRLASEIQAEITAEARLHKAGYYSNRDPDGSEKRRRIGLLTLAIHLERSLERAEGKVRECNDAGTCAVFEAAMVRVSALVNEDYFDHSNRSLAIGYSNVAPAFEACMNVCGLPELALPLTRVFPAYAEELTGRVLEAYRSL